MKLIIFFKILIFFVFIGSTTAQFDFVNTESELAFHCDVMANAAENRHRIVAMEKFNKHFYQALAEKGSFLYPFDSLKWISKKITEDKSFRIFTWEVKVAEGEVQYFGVLQTANDKIFIFKDQFKNAEGLAEEEFSHENWLGAVYYNLMEIKPAKGEKYYLLFGVNRWNRYENVKLVDVLFFTKEGIPYFGKPVFKRTEKDKSVVVSNRLVFKYAADGIMTVNYNPGMEMIVFDNLIVKMSRIPGQGETLVPDGSYVGYVWENDIWNRIDKIATEVMDEAPRPQPILDKRKGKKIFGN